MGMVVAERRSVSGVSGGESVPVPGEEVTSRASVCSAPDASISTVSSVAAVAAPAPDPASTDDAPAPLAPVPPSRRSNVAAGASGTRSATCLTAWCPRSIDCATKAVPMVAAADPMATPTIVPLTPKIDAMEAAITAPAAEARIWRTENFTPALSRRPPPVPRRGR